ncbi:hypothetical protein BY458DRAFT_495441, partial [Sporodiniella umbellata]
EYFPKLKNHAKNRPLDTNEGLMAKIPEDNHIVTKKIFFCLPKSILKYLNYNEKEKKLGLPKKLNEQRALGSSHKNIQNVTNLVVSVVYADSMSIAPIEFESQLSFQKYFAFEKFKQDISHLVRQTVSMNLRPNYKKKVSIGVVHNHIIEQFESKRHRCCKHCAIRLLVCILRRLCIYYVSTIYQRDLVKDYQNQLNMSYRIFGSKKSLLNITWIILLPTETTHYCLKIHSNPTGFLLIFYPIREKKKTLVLNELSRTSNVTKLSAYIN